MVTHLLPFELDRRISEGLAVFMDLLEDALIVNNGGVVNPQQGILPRPLGVVTDFCQIHAVQQLRGQWYGKVKKREIVDELS